MMKKTLRRLFRHSSGKPPLIIKVDPGSPAAAAGVPPGDRLVGVNGHPVRDELDLAFLEAERILEIALRSSDDKTHRATVVKDYDESLGIEIEPLRPRVCRNHCIFCFVDQNPSGLRRELYLKDEDFRLSFTHGSYITGTSLRREDIDRIIDQRLSPLYISVHAADHELRCRMIGVDPKRTTDVMDILRRLARHRITLHTQIVLCPGWNDGLALDETLDALEALWPSVQSIAVVPVGLTAHREGLAPLEPVTAETANRVIEQVRPRQTRNLEGKGERVTLLADEFYLTAKSPIPEYNEDEIEYQIENGVGMVTEFWRGWTKARALLDEKGCSGESSSPRRVHILTGRLSGHLLQPVVEALNQTSAVDAEAIPLTNTLYGESVTVSGLLSGADFERGVREASDSDLVLIPANALRPADERFLDDLTLDDLRRKHPEARLQVVEGGAEDIVKACLDFASQTKE